MVGISVCALAFIAAAVLAWRSVVAGLAVVMTAGYFYGILRANFLDKFSYFVFDAAVLGFFLSYFTTVGLKAFIDPKQETLQRWTFMLIGWAFLMFLVPRQNFLIQLVGLRGNAFLLPFLLVGGRLTRDDANGLALWFAVLNHVAFAFAIAEYFIGVPAFFPENTVTEIIYKSRDIGGTGYAAMRIPATFSHAAVYGGTMVLTVPWLLGAWVQPRLVDWQRMFLVSATAIAMISVFICGARTPVLMLGSVIVVATFSRHMRSALWVVWALVLGGVIYIVSGEDRMQRFTSLQDTDVVTQRIQVSVNVTFVDMLVKYPFGNGIGAGGTSIPAFLQELVEDPVAIENEYGRILLEQGVAGLVLWIAFIVWFIIRRPVNERDSWQFGRSLLWFLTVVSFAGAIMGIGLMTAIPGSMMFFLGIGMVAAPTLTGKSPPGKDRYGENAPAATPTNVSVAAKES